jgi:hypothetical protein
MNWRATLPSMGRSRTLRDGLASPGKGGQRTVSDLYGGNETVHGSTDRRVVALGLA